MKVKLAVLVCLLSLSNPLASLASEFKPLAALAPIPAENTMSHQKIELGKMLFFEPRLSSSNWISCATCHNPGLGFTDRIPKALGDKMTQGPRNTPTILNAAFLENQFWDGRAATLEEQALGPIQASIEMNEKLENAINKLKAIPEYVERFQASFQEENPVNAKNLAKAIAAFERILITPNAPFDRYLRGDKQALSLNAQEGMKLFKEKGCLDCHSGPALSDSEFHEIRVPGSTDLGRFKVTQKESDKYSFRTPSLRNIALTFPYMNDGSVPTLEGAVKLMGKAALDETLTNQEISKLVAFLKSLTGELPIFSYPVLP